MEPLLEDRLSAIEKKVDQTLALVTQMRRVQRNAHLVKIGYWLLLIVIAIISYSFIKPYISSLGEAYGLGDKEGSSYADTLKQLQELSQ